MRIKNRLYPYPVLRPSTGDYQHSTFRCNVTYVGDCSFTFDFVCTNKTILKMIDEGKALYAVHIECKYTYYRDLKYSKDAHFPVELDGSAVDQLVEICPVIIATEDLVGYSCQDLDDVYSGEHIVIKNGNPIAIGNQMSLEITKEKDNLKKLSQPFCVLPYPDDSPTRPVEKHASIDYTDNNQLIIYLPKEDYAILDRVQTPKNIDTVHAALYFSALIEAIDYIKMDVSDEDQDKRWYMALNAKAVDKGLGDIKGNSRSAFELAQIMFGYPVSRWLKRYTAEPGGEV